MEPAAPADLLAQRRDRGEEDVDRDGAEDDGEHRGGRDRGAGFLRRGRRGLEEVLEGQVAGHAAQHHHGGA